MRNLVTGGTGHIGNVLIRKLLEQNQKVTALLLPNESTESIADLDVEIVRGDITDRKFIFDLIKSNDVVYHLAGIIDIGTTPYEIVHNINFNGTKNIVDACVEKKAKKLVYTSTVHIIDPQNYGDILIEPENFNTYKIVGAYAKTKVEATEYVVNSAKKYDLDATVLYPAGVIGPYDFKISELGQVILDYINNKLLAYVKGGYNFVDVRDVANALINAAQKGRKGEGYIISNRPTSLKELLQIINKKLSRKKLPPLIEIWFLRAFAGISNLYYKMKHKKPVFSAYSLYTLTSNCNFSYEKAKNELDYNPINIEKTIYDAVDWFIEEKPQLVNLGKKDKVVPNSELLQ